MHLREKKQCDIYEPMICRLLYPMFQHVDLEDVQITCSTGQTVDEPYTTENLANINGGYKILTNIAELLRVSFCNLCVSDGFGRILILFKHYIRLYHCYCC